MTGRFRSELKRPRSVDWTLFSLMLWGLSIVVATSRQRLEQKWLRRETKASRPTIVPFASKPEGAVHRPPRRVSLRIGRDAEAAGQAVRIIQQDAAPWGLSNRRSPREKEAKCACGVSDQVCVRRHFRRSMMAAAPAGAGLRVRSYVTQQWRPFSAAWK